MQVRMMAGVPALNASLYRKIRFLVGDPVAFIEVDDNGRRESILILRDIEMERAKKNVSCDLVRCPNDYRPSDGLSGDREIATAQAAAEFLRQIGATRVTGDRSLPMIFVSMLNKQGIDVDCDFDWGVVDRRQKDAQEIDAISQAQHVTETVMRRACETIAESRAAADGSLVSDNTPLTSELMRVWIDQWLLELGYSNPQSIVACGSQGGDCHEHGHGPLFTCQPIIVDIFPKNKSSLYNGDCTRSVVHGQPSDEIVAMHRVVVEAKHEAARALRAGISGHQINQITLSVIRRHGYQTRLPSSQEGPEFTAMTHGAGHGLGLEVHEPPLLADNGIELLDGDVVTIEPGLYSYKYGGVRVEDLYVVTRDGSRNFNTLHEGLDWRTN